MGIIYLTENILNNKKYVGQTIGTLENRKSIHIYESIQRNSQKYFHRALRKYGIENFQWSIIEECDNNILNEREKYWIKFYNTYSKSKKDNGYNLTEGGDNTFGSAGEHHWLNKMNFIEKQEWIQKYLLGCNNPNYKNGSKTTGLNHFSKKSDEIKKEWIRKLSEDNYQKKLSKKELHEKNWWWKLSKDDQKKWIEINVAGNNNPFKKSLENPEKLAQFKDICKKGWEKRKLNPEKPRPKKTRIILITLPNGEIRKIRGTRKLLSYNPLSISKYKLRELLSGKINEYIGYKIQKIPSSNIEQSIIDMIEWDFDNNGKWFNNKED